MVALLSFVWVWAVVAGVAGTVGYMGGRVDFTRVTLPPCGYCLKASMTGRVHRPSGLRIKSAMTVSAPRFCLKASMTGDSAALHGCDLYEWLYFVGVGGYELHHFGEVVVSHVSLMNADDVVLSV